MINFFQALLVFTVLFLNSASAELILESKNQNIEVLNPLFFEDKSAVMPFAEVQKQNFQKTPMKVASFGFSSSAYWFKIEIKPSADAHLYKWWLNISYPLLDKLDLYSVDRNGKFISLRKSGRSRPFSERELKDRNFNFFIDSSREHTLYLRVQTQSSMQVPLSVQTSKSLFANFQYLWIFSGVYYGFFLLILFYNLISYIYEPSKQYFYYLMFIASFIVYQLSLDGTGAQFLYNDWPWMIQHGNGTMMSLMIVMIILFSKHFLQTASFTPKMDKLLTVLVFVMSVVTFFALFRPYSDVILPIASISIILPLILLSIGIVIYKKKFYPARFYILGWGSFLGGSMLFAMNKFALIEGYSILSYSQQIGSALEMIFLSWALADLQNQKKREYVEKLNGLNTLLQEKVDESLGKIRQNDKLLIEKSRFVAMGEMIEQIAHQWRQPLHTLALLNQNFYFKVQLGTVSKEDSTKTHDQINEQLQYMSQTIDDFRNFSKPNKGKEKFYIEDVISSSLSLNDGSLKSAKIKTHLFSKKKHEVYGVPQEMTQVFMNLIKNVQDVVREKKIQGAWLSFSIRQKDNTVIIEVKDNAGGIPLDKIGTIFDAYFSTKGAEGTGIGLYMSKEIIEKSMLGKISVDNTKEGAVFTITLPKGEEKK